MVDYAVICERWRMPLGGTDGSAWFLDWVRRKPRESSTHVTAGYAAYASLAKADGAGAYAKVVEYFGGMGCQSMIIQDRFHPVEHVIYEQHEMAVEHLRFALRGVPGVSVRHGDALQNREPADLFAMDFGDLTAHKANTVYRPTLEWVFSQKPRAVVITDIAGPKLPLHRARYGQIIGGTPRSYPEYLQGLTGWFEREFGCGLYACFYHPWSAVMAFIPGPPRGGPISPAGLTPKGIHLE